MTVVFKKRRMRRAKRKFPTKRRAIRKAVRGVQNARIKAVVKRVLGRQVETKILQTAGTIYVRPPESAETQANFNSTCMCLTPQGGTIGSWTGGGYPILGNGIGQDQRIGDECKIKATYFNYQLIPQSYNATTNPLPCPQIICLFFVRPKIRNTNGLSVAEVMSGASATFFENQANADSGLSGSPIDLLRKIDRDNWTVVAIKQHKVGFSGNLNTTNVVSSFGNNDFKQYIRGRVKMPSYVWKADRQEFYEGRNTYVFAVAYRADGSGGTGYSVQLPVICNFNLAHYFTDM